MSDTLEAVVQVGTEETCYLRCGQGPVVVAVTDDTDDRARLIALLRSDYRVIAPLPPLFVATSADPAAGVTEWIRGVIDGLGLAAPHILLSGRFAGLIGLGTAEEY